MRNAECGIKEFVTWSAGVMEHWSVGRKDLQNRSAGIQEK